MKYISLTLFFLSCALTLVAQNCRTTFKGQLEKNSKLIRCSANTSLEKTADKKYIFKTYYVETNVITEYATYRDKRLSTLEGLYVKRWDDGTIVQRGTYKNNRRDGMWIMGTNQKGRFVNGEKEGPWRTYRKDSLIAEKVNYKQGLLDGIRIVYDSIGNVSSVDEYERGELTSTTRDTSLKVVETMPMFPGCSTTSGDLQKQKECADRKFLEYVYGNIKYPQRAREEGIEGAAVIQFVINKDGSVKDVKVLNGLCKEIKEQTIEIIKSMPTWIPGTQNGEAVKVLFTLPIMYKLH